jgi:ParB family chromosome partitioning protein
LLDLDDAVALAERVIDHGLNVRQSEALARSARAVDGGGRSSRPAAGGDADTLALQADLEDVLGLKVQIRDRDGVGEIRIAYRTLEQLDDLCRLLSQPLRR